jgi:hypothetical protein
MAEAGPFAPGTYQVALKSNVGNPAELSQSVEVVSASVEKRELSADPDLMRKLAEISGGSVLAANDIARMPEVVRRWEAARQLAHRQQPNLVRENVVKMYTEYIQQHPNEVAQAVALDPTHPDLAGRIAPAQEPVQEVLHGLVDPSQMAFDRSGSAEVPLSMTA